MQLPLAAARDSCTFVLVWKGPKSAFRDESNATKIIFLSYREGLVHAPSFLVIFASAGRADVYRGANSILRLVVEGRLCVRLVPPNYTSTPIVGGYLELLSDLMRFATKEEEEEEEEDESFSEEEESSEGDEEDVTSEGNAFSLLTQLDD